MFGTGTTAWVDNSPVNIGYLKFDLTPYAGKTITAATLKVRTTSSTSAGSGGTTTVRQVSDDSWTEGALTYNTRKALGTHDHRLPGGTVGHQQQLLHHPDAERPAGRRRQHALARPDHHQQRRPRAGHPGGRRRARRLQLTFK